MFRNYLLTAYRNLVHNKEYSIINVSGLAVGLASCLVLFYILQYEMSFDAFHTKRQRIFRITSEASFPGGMDYNMGVPAPLPDAMRQDFPQLEQVGAILSVPRSQIDILDSKHQGHQEFMEDLGVFFVEPQFFKIFNFGWLHGSPDALIEPNSVVLTQEAAEKYFGDWRNAIGKSIEYANKDVLKVTGILKNIPSTSDFPLKVVISFTTRGSEISSWGSVSGRRQCYILLDEYTSAGQIRDIIPAFEKKYHPVEDKIVDHYLLQPLEDIHFDGRFGNFNGRTVERSTLWSLVLIGMLVIITASINFVNLAVAQIMKRSKEVGVRKALGSSHRQLALQFFGETFLIVVAASLLAVVMTQMALPSVRSLLNFPASFHAPSPMDVTLLLGVLIVALTIISGIYPARVLGSSRPVQALKGKASNQSIGGMSLRKTLIVIQFAIAQGLVISTLIIVEQLDFFRNTPMGFDRESIILFNVPTDSLNQRKGEAFRQTLLKEIEIENIAFSFSAPLSGSNWRSSFQFNHSVEDSPFEVNVKFADLEYFSTYKLSLVAGRFYEPSDTAREFLVNETFLEKLGITSADEGIGKMITMHGATLPIVGVLKDFHLVSLQEKTEPLVVSYNPAEFRTVSVKIHPGNLSAGIQKLERIYKSFYPKDVFQFRYFTENVNRLYVAEERLSWITRIFSFIAIFISSLGLYGLISFMATQRTKEVGIRKVLGASVTSILIMFYKEFIGLILIAFLFTTPITGYFMSEWLKTFAYRIDLSPRFFFLAMSLSLLLSLAVISYRSAAAAMANPVDSLRNE
jgi:putative ABC transport system permease protein